MKSKAAINITIIDHEGRQVCCDAEDKCLFMVTYRVGNRLIHSCNLDGTWVDGMPKQLETDGDLVIPKSNCPLLNIPKKVVASRKQSVVTPESVVKPTLEEVKEYAESKGFTEWQKFYDYYSADDWNHRCKNGKYEPIRSWKQKLLMWKDNQNQRRNQSYSKGQYSPPPRREGILVV